MTLWTRTVLACVATTCIHGCAGDGGNNPGAEGGATGSGIIISDGKALDYVVSAPESELLLLVRKEDAPACSFFHHHAVAARAVGFAFALVRASPATSMLSATVSAAGLDPDGAEDRGKFRETSSTTMTARERSDIRANVLDQVGAGSHPVMTFTARNFSTLDGNGTAVVSVDLKGLQSTLVMHATAQWDGERLVMEGTGTIDGAQHDIPVGTFRDCIESAMDLKMRIVLVPGRNNAATPDAGAVQSWVRQDFPEAPGACGPVGFAEVQNTLLMRCAGCHGNPPTQGATLPLMTVEDFRRDSLMSPGIPLYVDAAERMLDNGLRQMPPSGATQLAPDEQQALLAWARGGGHANACDGGAATPSPAEGVEGDAGTPACSTAGYAEVRGVFERRCTSCHAVGGSAVALDSREAGLAPATHPGYAGMTLWQAAVARMEDGSMPPGGGAPRAAELEQVRRWVEAGAPDVGCASDGGVHGGNVPPQ